MTYAHQCLHITFGIEEEGLHQPTVVVSVRFGCCLKGELERTGTGLLMILPVLWLATDLEEREIGWEGE